MPIPVTVMLSAVAMPPLIPVNAVRNLLVQQLSKLDVLFVVDATHNKAAWFNFGPEADSRIRRIWTKTPDAARLQVGA